MAILKDMDELVIDDKKYVSSKRAAKLTGYAKDYVGQLCREGRVPARLVGRSWYVLESAIHDHRFSEKEPEKPSSSSAVFSSTWGSPKYEAAAPVEPMPIIEKEEEAVMEAQMEPQTMAEQLQESWKAWFERVGEPAEGASDEPELAAEEPRKEETATTVPIKAIHHEVYQPLPHEFMPRRTEISEAPAREEVQGEVVYESKSRGSMVSLQLAGALLALVMAVLAVAGTGYFDGYILKTQNFGSVAGVQFYNR